LDFTMELWYCTDYQATNGTTENSSSSDAVAILSNSVELQRTPRDMVGTLEFTFSDLPEPFLSILKAIIHSSSYLKVESSNPLQNIVLMTVNGIVLGLFGPISYAGRQKNPMPKQHGGNTQ
jgi:hypothetical protein